MKFVQRLKTDSVFRTTLSFFIAFAINIAFAVYNGVYGILFSSVWFATLCVYYALLAFLRGAVVLHIVKNRKNNDSGANLKIYRLSGILLMVLTIALAGAVVLMVVDGQTFRHAGLMIYIAASYTTYKIVAAIVNFVKTRKSDHFAIKAMRSIGFADALVSVLALQTAMISQFSGNGEDLSAMNAVTGGAVCAIIIALGVFMIINSTLKLKNKRIENEEV
ncbi:MAG: hypothetical protein K2N52_04480 [Clostridia bacterium]|nr:hypothetical protein [Clostridia bacterium]